MKRASYLRDLSSEHHRALVLVREISARCTQGGDQTVLIDKVRSAFETELEPHFRQEEESLLPALTQAGEAGLVEQTLLEHKQLRELIQHLEEGDALCRFATQLKAHVRFEERELFPTCQHRFDAATIASIEGRYPTPTDDALP